jgi:pimeloyl-ACP methyl ester carboxylesterase
MNSEEGRLIDIGDTSLYTVERGRGYPVIILHGGPGLDHHMFGDYLDALTDDYRLILVDQRANGRSGRPPEDTWTLEQNAKDVGLLAKAMGLDRYAVLGHSFLISDQLPFHFADPFDPRIAELEQRMAGTVYSPEVLRKFSSEDYGGIEVEDRLGDIPQPVLVLAGRYDRTCSVEAAEFIAVNVPNAELVVFEKSAHMTFVEENERYVTTVRAFLDRHNVS